MTTVTDHTQHAAATHPAETHGHEVHGAHGHGDHPDFLAHHFDSPQQQFDAGKLGIWLFLVTEILFFSGLFVAYTIYRTMHPDIFEYAHQFLNKYLGAINTGVLLFSSLTMAWGVRCAQLGKRWGLVNCLGLTLFCAALFLGVKTFEYTEKFEKRLLWSGAFVDATNLGKENRPNTPAREHLLRVNMDSDKKTLDERVESDLGYIMIFWFWTLMIPLAMTLVGHWMNYRSLRTTGVGGLIGIVGIMAGIQVGLLIHHNIDAHGPGHGSTAHAGDNHAHDDDAHPDAGHSGESEAEVATDLAKTEPADAHTPEKDMVAGTATETEIHQFEEQEKIPRNASVFFSIYYFMTGLHAIHILGGMIALTWLLVRAVNNDFNPLYFGPVDYVGLYWHLVDLIWIYLFPLLYLIH